MSLIWKYLCLLLCLWPGEGGGQNTLHVQYYRPGNHLEEQLVIERTNFLLRCNAISSQFHPLSVHEWEAPEIAPDHCWIYKDQLQRVLLEYTTTLQQTPYTIADTLPRMNWAIYPDTKTLKGQIEVRRARTQYRGRSFTAWFAPAIPIPDGPWKLNGLPGLILEAYDDRREIVFMFHALRSVGSAVIPKPAQRGQALAPSTFLHIRERELRQYLNYVADRLRTCQPDLDIGLQYIYSFWEDP